MLGLRNSLNIPLKEHMKERLQHVHVACVEAWHTCPDNDFIKSKTVVRAAEPMDDDACNISEGGDEGSVRNLLSSMISGTCHGEINEDEPNVAAKKIFKLMEEGQKELYPGCKEASHVSFIVRLFQIKCMCGISNNAMEQILHLIYLVLKFER